MFEQMLRKGIVLVLVGVAFLPLSLFLRQELTTSVGGEPTNEVFVPANSEASERGFALPGEGTPAYFIGGQLDRAGKVRALSVLEIALGLTMIAASLLARSVAGRQIGTAKGGLGILFSLAGSSIGLLIVGGFAGFLIFAPLKVLPDGLFNAVFLLLGLGSLLFVYLQRINISEIIH